MSMSDIADIKADVDAHLCISLVCLMLSSFSPKYFLVSGVMYAYCVGINEPRPLKNVEYFIIS